jgi:RNA polymerase sigma-70 factor (ECF subfamily)
MQAFALFHKKSFKIFKLSLKKELSSFNKGMRSDISENNQNEEQKLIRVFSETNDPEILADLYSPYMHLVYGVCLKYLRNRDDAKDAVMQIFEKLIIEIPRQKIANFHNWLYVVTKNYCLMQLRSDKTNREKAEEWLKNEVFFMENEQQLHPIDRDESDIDKELEDCIRHLKDEQKMCIDQFYYDNRSYNEIAANLNIDEKKVKSYLQNAKRNLKLCLEEKHVRQK